MTDKLSFDSALYIALQQYKCDQLENIPPLEQLSVQFKPSDELKEKIEKLIREKENNKNSGLKKLGKAAVIMLVVFTLLSNSTVVTAINNIVPGFIVQWNDKYTSITTHSDVKTPYIEDFIVHYVPNGYTMVQGDKLSKIYQNGDISVRVAVNLESNYNSFNIDNEETIFENIVIDGHDGMRHIHQDGYNGIIMSVGGVSYHITGHIPPEEIVKIFQSIEVIFQTAE